MNPMATQTASVDEQVRVLMRGVEYGDAGLQRTMEEELRQRLSEGRPLRVYAGFDPTMADLHIGHMIPMLKLRQFQRFGHEVTFLMGTFTATIGDPSDKTSARQMLTAEEVEANTRTWLRQAYRVLDEDKTAVARNGEWLAGLSMADVVQLASNFTVGQFLDHETFRRRMDEGKPLYLHEFIYALMQAYDAHTLQTDVQVGGVDQLFNIMAGRQLQRALGERPLTAVCTPLLIGTDGALKMSKSTGNYVGLDEPPADMYGKLMSIPDSLLPNYYRLLTEVSEEDLQQLDRDVAERRLNPMDAKKRLARSVVALLYDEESAAQAQEEFERVFQRREDPEESAQTFPLPLDPGGGAITIDITQALSEGGIVASRSEARRLLSQGALALDGETLKKPRVEVREGSLIRVGRHRFLRVVPAVGA
jgi:tyrosyl-tRNA synthetase